MLGEQLIKACQIRRQIGRSVLAGLQFGLDALDKRLQFRIHGTGGAIRGLGGEAGRHEARRGEQQDEEQFDFHSWKFKSLQTISVFDRRGKYFPR